MQVCVLGPLLILDGANEIAAGGPLQRRVLARLAMDGGRPVAIRQPVAPTEQADREWTLSQGRLVAGGPGAGVAADFPEILDPIRAHQLAPTLAGASARPAAAPRRRRARG